MGHLWDSGYSVREPSWHGLATILDSHPENWGEARKAAGLEWEVAERDLPVIDWDDNKQPHIAHDTHGHALIDPDYKAITRSDNGKRLAITSSTYEVISMEDFGIIFESVLEEPNVKFETAGSLDEGRLVWALAYLNEPMQIGNDPSQTVPYLLLTSRHDGAGAAQLIPTTVRVICANTVKLAEMEGDSRGAVYSFRHTANWRSRIKDAKEAVQGSRREFAAFREISEELYKKPVTSAQREWFVEAFMPYPPEGTFTDRVRRNVDASRDQLRLLAYEETNEKVSSTAYGLVQMGVEYLDHIRPYRHKKSYFGRTMMTPEKQKTRLVKLAHKASEIRV